MLVLSRKLAEEIHVLFDLGGRPVVVRVVLVQIPNLSQSRLGFEAVYEDTGKPVPRSQVEIHRQEIRDKIREKGELKGQ